MTEPLRLKLPFAKADLAPLEIGQQVLLSGPVYTCRDAGHMRALKALEKTGELPFGLSGQTIFYAGPTPASRMDFATPALMDAGLAACIGKGKRSRAVIDACVRNGCVYFAAVGGIAALLATHVTSTETIAWDDLGTEALRRIELSDFPVFVAVDTKGADLYRSIEAAAQA